jgi:hypothetical protein
VDRTPVNFYEDAKNAVFGSHILAEEDDKDDEWLPNDGSDANSEPLEYDTEASSDAESSKLQKAMTTVQTTNMMMQVYVTPYVRCTLLRRRSASRTALGVMNSCIPDFAAGNSSSKSYRESSWVHHLPGRPQRRCSPARTHRCPFLPKRVRNQRSRGKRRGNEEQPDPQVFASETSALASPW